MILRFHTSRCIRYYIIHLYIYTNIFKINLGNSYLLETFAIYVLITLIDYLSHNSSPAVIYFYYIAINSY